MSSNPRLIGQLAVQRRMINLDQLRTAVKEQSVEPEPVPLGQLLLRKGWITQAQLEDLVRASQITADEQPTYPPEQHRPPESAADRSPSAHVAKPRSSETPPHSAAESSHRNTGSSPQIAPAPQRVRSPKGIDTLLSEAVAVNASDLHLHAGAPMLVRRHGELETVSEQALEPAQVQALLEPLLDDEQRAQFDRHGQVDLAFELQPISRFRANIYREHHGWSGVFRAIPIVAPNLESLGLPGTLARFANFHQGMVLITGPAGCGKTTTMAALVELLNNERREHILTVEDPIEFVFESRASTINQRQVQRHTESFAAALRGALREDPDILVIGELRDPETISLALTAAETGHLVFATQTTSNAVRTIERLIGAFPARRQRQVRAMVSESLKGVISQRLVRRKDGMGRLPAQELLFLDTAVGNLIRDEKTFQIDSVLQTGAKRGQQLLDSSLRQLVAAGKVELDEALRHAVDPARVRGQSSAPNESSTPPGPGAAVGASGGR